MTNYFDYNDLRLTRSRAAVILLNKKSLEGLRTMLLHFSPSTPGRIDVLENHSIVAHIDTASHELTAHKPLALATLVGITVYMEHRR